MVAYAGKVHISTIGGDAEDIPYHVFSPIPASQAQIIRRTNEIYQDAGIFRIPGLKLKPCHLRVPVRTHLPPNWRLSSIDPKHREHYEVNLKTAA